MTVTAIDTRPQFEDTHTSEQPPTVLLVEDALAERSRLSAMIQRLGYRVLESDSGLAALQLLRTETVDVVLSDWVMPGMDGLTLCREVQGEWGERRPHFIMLTARNQGADLVAGMDAGADDFIGKPAAMEELSARLRAGCRQLQLRRNLERRYARLRQRLQREQHDQAELHQGLEAASQLQRRFLPGADAPVDGLELASLYMPRDIVSGDGMGLHELVPGIVGAFVLDVDSQGVAAAMQSIGLQHRLTPEAADDGLLMSSPGQPAPAWRVAERLNEVLHDNAENEAPVTLAYCVLDLARRRGELCLAGHPPALLLRADGSSDWLGLPNPALGTQADASYRGYQFSWNAGDRLVLYTDGLVDRVSSGRQGEACSQGLRDHLAGLAEVPVALLGSMLREWLSQREDADDASALVIGL